MSDQVTQEEKKNPLEIEKARAILITEQPFYACLLQACKFSWDDRVGTAGVRVNSSGQVELAVSRKFWDKLEDYEGVGLLMHEMLHILHEHLTRGKELNMKIANIGMDIAINQYIPKGWLPKGALLPEMKNPDGTLLWKLEPKRAFEVYYVELMKLLKDKMQQNGNSGQGGEQGKNKQENSNGNDQSQGNQEQKDQDQGNGLPNTLDNHDYSEDERASGEGVDGKVTEEMKKLAYDALINKAVSDTKERFPGSIPLHVEQAISERFKPAKVDWRRELRRYIGRKQARVIESTRNKLNRRLGVQAPGYRKNYTPNILIAVDCSGSVSDKEYVAFMNEIKNILSGQDDKTEIIFFDYEICKDKLVLSDLKEIPNRPAYGGTNFEPVVKYADEKKPDLLIIFTDGDAPCPKKPNYPILWALVGRNNGEALVGKKVKIDDVE
jgi:predicted metal-dependent peptidase